MVDRKVKNNTNKIIEFYIKWGQKSFLFTLVCIVWLAWRISTKPSRLNYPCSQFAIWQITLYFSTISTPLIGICHRCISYIRQRNYHKIAGVVLIILVLTGTFSLYSEHIENQLRITGSGTIPASSSAISPWVSTTDLGAVSQYLDFPHNISPDHAVVSFSHDPLIDYGGAPPYDPEFNPAYDFVWETVEKLRLGNHTNPLDDLIDEGDTVLIKPNWVGFGPGTYTRPEVVRPLIDMAIEAGAARIYVGDGGEDVAGTNTVMTSANFTSMVSILDSLYPAIDIRTVNLNTRGDGWHWVSLSSNSSFAGSGIDEYALGTGSATLFDHDYYHALDNQSVNPEGHVLGWYAVNDYVLNADVIINVPKLKTHQEMIATISLKNFVGCTLSSTFNNFGYLERIAHHHQPKETNYFTNNIFWRAILDMNKIILYADADGVLQPDQQRKYLTVVDAIQGMEKSQHHSYGGGGIPYDTRVILAGVDPVAVDAVGCRIMGYDYRVIPSINYPNSDNNTDTVHPIGTNDPQDIIIIGDNIDAGLNHVFTFNANWDTYAGSLPISDFTPPVINSIARQGMTVTANISDCLAAYILYQADGLEYIEKMTEDSDTYSGNITSTTSEYFVIAQDEYFNRVQSTPQTIEDTTPPYTSGHTPSPGESGVPVDTNIVVHVLDDGEGVDFTTITMTVEGVPVSLAITGNSTDYTLTYDPPVDFNHLQVVDVAINVSDLATPANAMTEDSYSFTTVQEEHTLTVNTVGSGNVTLNPPGGSYPFATMVELTANAASGWTFSGWSGDLDGSDNPETITMDSNKSVNATFTQNTYTLTVNTIGSGNVTLNPAGGSYLSGTAVELTANATPGWAFYNWTGDVGTLSDVNAASTFITMDEDYTITANFARIQQDGNGGGGGGGGGGGDTTSLSEYTTSSGKFVVDAAASSADGKVKIEIPKDTIGKDRNGNRLRFITIKKQEAPADPPANCAFVCLTYNIGPGDATLEPHGYLVFHYDDADVPAGVAEEDLVLATWQDGAWVELEGCVVNPDENTITAPVGHFSIFTAMAHTAPAEFELTGMNVVPVEVQPDEPVTLSVIVINTGDLTGIYDVVLNINSTAVQDKSVTLKGGESQTVSFTVTRDTGGVYIVNIGILSGSFTVKEPEGKAVAASVDETPEATPEPTSKPAETPVKPTQPTEPTQPVAEPVTTEKAPAEPTSSHEIAWWLIVIYVAAGVIVVGLGTFYFMRRRSAE